MNMNEMRRHPVARICGILAACLILALYIAPQTSAKGETASDLAIYRQFVSEYGEPGFNWTQEIWRSFSEALRALEADHFSYEPLRYIAFQRYEEPDTEKATAYSRPMNREEAIEYARQLMGSALDGSEDWHCYALAMGSILMHDSWKIWNVSFYRSDGSPDYDIWHTSFYCGNGQVKVPPRHLTWEDPWYAPFVNMDVAARDQIIARRLAEEKYPPRLQAFLTQLTEKQTVSEALIGFQRQWGLPPNFFNNSLEYPYDPQGEDLYYPPDAMVCWDAFRLSNTEEAFPSLPGPKDYTVDALLDLHREDAAIQTMKRDTLRCLYFEKVFDASTQSRRSVWLVYFQYGDASSNASCAYCFDAETGEQLDREQIHGNAEGTVG